MSKKGFTLIEVIISIAALGIICAVLLRLFVLAGNTNKKAGLMQSAQIAVSSTIETLDGADNIDDALAALGLTASGKDADGSYTLVRDTCTVVLDISRETGDYPGELYSFSVKAVDGGKELASIETARYYGRQTHG